MANIANIIQSTIASAERVFEMMDEEEEKDEIPANVNQVAGEEHSIVFIMWNLVILRINL